MLHIRKEGEKVKYGFNFYGLTDPSSIGFKLKYAKYRAVLVRYSKLRHKFNFKHIVVDPVKVAEFKKLFPEEQQSGL